MSSYDTPISEDSERAIFAIEAKDEKALAKTLDKWMRKETDVEKHQVGQYTIYERVRADNLYLVETSLAGPRCIASSGAS